MRVEAKKKKERKLDAYMRKQNKSKPSVTKIEGFEIKVTFKDNFFGSQKFKHVFGKYAVSSSGAESRGYKFAES